MIALPAVDLRVITPELVLAGTALVVLVWGVFLPVGRQRSLRWLSAAGIAVALGEVLTLAPSGAAFGGMYVRDALTGPLQATALLGALLALWLSGDYVERTHLESGEFYALLLTSALGAMLMAAGGDLLMLFLGLETLSIPLYVLAAFARGDPRSQEAGMKYFLLGAFATVFFLYGVALIYGAAGSTNLARLAARAGEGAALLPVGMGLLVIGLGFKAALVPFHSWAPDVYEGAPLPVTAYMAVIAKVGAFAALLRVFVLALPALAGRWVPILAAVSVLTMALGNVAALAQTNLKRLLAYSGIAHSGFMLVGVVAGSPAGTSAVVFYLLAYTFMTLGAFGVLLMLQRRGEEADTIGDLVGLAWRSPLLAGAMAVFMISLAGLPPTAGFIAKFYAFTAVVDAGQTGVAIVAVLTSVISAYYYLRVAYTMFTGRPGDEVTLTGGRWVSAALVVAVVGVLALGILPATVAGFIQKVEIP